MSWLHPGLLAFALLALVPALLHWLLRDRIQRVAFAGMRFLGAASTVAAARARWVEILLMALRGLALLLLGVAFARPFLAHADNAQPLAIVLVDCSRSMAAGERFARARAEADAVVRKLPAGERVIVAGVGPAGCALSAATDAAGAAHSLAGIARAGGPADLLAALAAAGSRSGGAPCSIHLISALPASGIPAARGRAPLPPNCRLVVHDVARAGDVPDGAVRLTAELAVAELAPGADNLAVPVSIANPGAARAVRVVLVADGKEQDQATVPLPAGGSASVTLHGSLREPGEIACTVTAADAPGVLPGDEQARLVAHVVRQVAVTVVDGAPSADPAQDPAYFVIAALTAGGGGHFSVATADALPPLDQMQVVVLACPRRISPEDTARLERFVRGGGGLLILLGPDGAPAELDGALSSLAGARLRRWRQGEVTLAADPAGAAFVERMLGDHPEELAGARISASAELADTAGSRVLLRFSDQRPALLSTACGDGTTLLMATALDRRVGDLPLRPLFVPLVLEAVRSLHQDAGRRSSLATGAAVALGSGERLTGGACAEDGDGRVRPIDPGFYRVEGAHPRLVAVNGDIDSSLPAVLAPEDLQRLVEPTVATVRATARGLERTLDGDEVRRAEARFGLGRWCLTAIVLLLFVELLVAQAASRE